MDPMGIKNRWEIQISLIRFIKIIIESLALGSQKLSLTKIPQFSLCVLCLQREKYGKIALTKKAIRRTRYAKPKSNDSKRFRSRCRKKNLCFFAYFPAPLFGPFPTWKRLVRSLGEMVVSRPQIPNSTRFMTSPAVTKTGLGKMRFFAIKICVDPKLGGNLDPENFRSVPCACSFGSLVASHSTPSSLTNL